MGTWKHFTAGKRRVEEHGVVLTDIIYRTFFMLSMPTTYQMTVAAIESQVGVTLEAAQNRLLEEWRNRKGHILNVWLRWLNLRVSPRYISIDTPF